MTYDLSAPNESGSEHAVHGNEFTPRKGRDRIFFFFFFLLVTDKAPLNLTGVVAVVDFEGATRQKADAWGLFCIQLKSNPSSRPDWCNMCLRHCSPHCEGALGRSLNGWETSNQRATIQRSNSSHNRGGGANSEVFPLRPETLLGFLFFFPLKLVSPHSPPPPLPPFSCVFKANPAHKEEVNKNGTAAVASSAQGPVNDGGRGGRGAVSCDLLL